MATQNPLFFPDNAEENKVVLPARINRKLIENYAPQRHENSGGYSYRKGDFKVFDAWYYKCAEYAAALFLQKFNLPFVNPDTQIYKSNKKSWKCDLQYDNITFLDNYFDSLYFHVKSMSQRTISRGYKESFVFQLANFNRPGGRDALLDSTNDNDYCVFVHVPYETITYGSVCFYIRSIISWNFIRENNLLENLQSNKFKGLKTCVYTNSLKKFLDGRGSHDMFSAEDSHGQKGQTSHSSHFECH